MQLISSPAMAVERLKKANVGSSYLFYLIKLFIKFDVGSG